MLLVNKQFPEDASEISKYKTAICIHFPKVPEKLLKQNDPVVVFDEQYTPFFLEVDFGENEMYLSHREIPTSDTFDE